MRVCLERAARFSGRVLAPGDKSLSHRALIFSALAEGVSSIAHLAPGEDVRATAACLSALGVGVRLAEGSAEVLGVGLSGFRAPQSPLDCGNSGTTMRLLAGVLAGAGLDATLDGDASLRRRPMRRVLEPLREMGARCEGERDARGEERAPLRFFSGALLQGKRHRMKVASAQVKSCLLLAGLFAEGETSVAEPYRSRDHTERMLQAMGAPLSTSGQGGESGGEEGHGVEDVTIRRPTGPLAPFGKISIPGDPSSAALLLGAALLVPGSDLSVEGVGVNPTRIGFWRVLERMGARLSLTPEGEQAGEPVATLRAWGGAPLSATEILPEEIPSLVDEIPILAVIASQAQGDTVIRGAAELRVKESDRLAQMARGLSAMGALVEERPDGLVIHGPTPLRGAVIDSARDHRIAMSFAAAALCAEGETVIEGAEWADTSFPGFFPLLSELTRG